MGWCEDVVQAFENLGGEADLSDVYGEIAKLRPGEPTPTYESTVRRVIESNSSDSKVWQKGNPDLFQKVGRGRWALRAGRTLPRINEVIDGISRADILQGIQEFDKGEQHSFADSIRYDLKHEGRRYPPKAVIGLAARRQLGRPLSPAEFSGGIDSLCFRILARHGFEVVEKAGRPESTQPGDGMLPEAPTGSVWMEITKSSHEHGGAGWEFGTCLWSPSSASDGKDWYGPMREAEPGDLVIHCLDSHLVGFSFIGARFREVTDQPPKAGTWAGRKSYYRVDLRDFVRFSSPVGLPEFLRKYGSLVRENIESHRPSKYPFILEHSGKIKTVQGGYLCRCTPALYDLIREALHGNCSEGGSELPQDTYGIDDAMIDLFVPREQFEAILNALLTKKNVVLQGPPGVGKTFVARRVAWALLRSRDDARVRMVQFHQSYAYEDFIQPESVTLEASYRGLWIARSYARFDIALAAR